MTISAHFPETAPIALTRVEAGQQRGDVGADGAGEDGGGDGGRVDRPGQPPGAGVCGQAAGVVRDERAEREHGAYQERHPGHEQGGVRGRGSWVACSAIGSAPMTVPVVMAISAHQNVRPIDTTIPPRTTLNTLKLQPHQKGSWCHALPCLALAGMNSM